MFLVKTEKSFPTTHPQHRPTTHNPPPVTRPWGDTLHQSKPKSHFPSPTTHPRSPDPGVTRCTSQNRKVISHHPSTTHAHHPQPTPGHHVTVTWTHVHPEPCSPVEPRMARETANGSSYSHTLFSLKWGRTDSRGNSISLPLLRQWKLIKTKHRDGSCG